MKWGLEGARTKRGVWDFGLRYISEMKEGGTGDGWVAGVKERLKDGLIDEGWRD